MFRAIGIVIIIYSLSVLLSGAFHSFESATIAVLETVETAAHVSTIQLEKATVNE